jgi:hypothetical protein
VENRMIVKNRKLEKKENWNKCSNSCKEEVMLWIQIRTKEDARDQKELISPKLLLGF